MGKIEDIKQAGIPIDDKSVSDAEIVDRLRERGIEMTPRTIYLIRAGSLSGAGLHRKLELQRVPDGDSRVKDNLYHRLAKKAISSRQQNHRGHYTNIGLTSAVSNQSVGISQQDLSRLFRAMSTDMVLSENEHPDKKVRASFDEAIDRFMEEYGRSYPSSISLQLGRQWDRRESIAEFYRKGFELPSVVMKTWIPYEVEVLADFYQGRIEAGSCPSPLDLTIVQTEIQRIPRDEVVQSTRALTGIRYTADVHFAHSNVLRHGRPTSG